MPEKNGYVRSDYLELIEKAEQNSEMDMVLLMLMSEEEAAKYTEPEVEKPIEPMMTEPESDVVKPDPDSDYVDNDEDYGYDDDDVAFITDDEDNEPV